MNWLLEQEPWIRLGGFTGVLAALAIWEILAPRRSLSISKPYRWFNNLGIVALDTLAVRLIFPTAAVGVALLAETREWGFWHLLEFPFWLKVVLSMIVLDFTIWAQHVMFHAVPALWRLHRMHHADLDFDVTTGLRFHPLEIVLSMVIKAGVILMLGAPAVAVLLFEVLLNATSMFNHSNVRLPRHIDRVVRWLVVTPDMHRVHHSWHPNETNSNFGFNLPWWDRLLGTYQGQPREGHESMTLGLNLFRDPAASRLDRLLIQPMIGPTHSYPINQREPTDTKPTERSK
ncbi:sterol desaturase family protein [Litchfieldella xinjiangensis]|uniref:sterol desaturase family protein n=1 Tax=Litchfieldella xinjiangensis TaxID=1166948 RepID=UPI0005BE9700|nr:sterol desaturase family protein [Halomonas xinjiangensis]